MHFCRFNLKFLGLGYKSCESSYWSYSVETFQLYQCNKCGKIILKNKEKHNHIHRHVFMYCIEDIERSGYKPLGELLQNREEK